MTTKTIDGRAETYSRPAARFDAAGNLEIRASAASNCRRALWYEATGHRVSNPPNGESLTMLEAGNALEPVVLKAMERAGWEVVPARFPGAPAGVGAGAAQPRGYRPPRRHGYDAHLRRQGGDRG